MTFSRIAAVAAGTVLLGLATAGLTATAVPPPPTGLTWADCLPEGDDDPAVVKGSQCATLRVPIDWRNPSGPAFELAVARRQAQGDRVGVLVFGPGGPGDSGVDRIKTGIDRFSADVQDRFDIVSFDPRGVVRSNPVLCSAELLAQQPSPIIKSASEFTATVNYNKQLAEDCREHTGPLYDHIDTWQSVRDVDAVRRALGESTITFHGSSYGTVLGAQYAETYPQRVRAMVLESVADHSSATTRDFLDDQAAAAQDSFDEFVKWCDATTTCALHGQNVHAVWADLLAQSPDPFTLSFRVFRQLYGPDWAGVAEMLKAGATPAKPVQSGVAQNPLMVFCQDWNLPVRSSREYAAHLDRLARNNPDMRYPGQLMAPSLCLGAPPADNPQHRLDVRGLDVPVLLANAVHDPATPYQWARSVERQLGRYGVLLTYEGWGHGSYGKSPCMQSTIDSYLIARDVPRRGSSCPAVSPEAVELSVTQPGR